MPNYSLVVDATYDPLSYQELVAPVKEAAAYHQALQDKYDELEMNTQMYDRYIGEDSPLARQAYDRYISKLNDAASVLASKGAWGQRDLFSGVRRSYGSDMLPIIQGFKTRADEAAAQMKAGPNFEFSRRAKDTNLDWYLSNPMGGYEVADKAQGAKMVADASKQFTNYLTQHPDGVVAKKLEAIYGTGYLESVMRYGLPPEVISEWWKYPELRAIMNNVVNHYGMSMDSEGHGVANNRWDKDATDRFIGTAALGFAAGAGQEKVTYMQDLQWAAEQKAAAAAAKNGGAAAGYGAPNNHSWTVDDSLTNGAELGRMERMAANFGVSYDKKTGKFSADKYKSGLEAIFKRLMYNPKGGLATLEDSIPFLRSTEEILEELAQENGWEFKSGYRGMGIVRPPLVPPTIRKNGKPVTSEELAEALNKRAAVLSGSYHTVQDTSLTGYNDVYKSLKIYPVSGINKDGSFKVDSDKATTVGDILSDKEVKSSQTGVSMTPTNNGIMVKASKNGKIQHYYIPAKDISDPNIRSAVEELTRRANMRAAGANLSDNDKLALEAAFNNALLQYQGSIGGTNSIPGTNLYGD